MSDFRHLFPAKPPAWFSPGVYRAYANTRADAVYAEQWVINWVAYHYWQRVPYTLERLFRIDHTEQFAAERQYEADYLWHYGGNT